MEVDLETLKNTSVVELPREWGTGGGGRWRYAEGSRNKIRGEGLTRMRARRLKGVELGKAVLVSGRWVNFGASTAELLPCGSKSCGVAEHSFPAIPRASRLHQPWGLSSGCSQGGSGRLDYNKRLSFPSSCPCSFVCWLFYLLTTFHLNKVTIFCFWAWTDHLYSEGRAPPRYLTETPYAFPLNVCLQHAIVGYMVDVSPVVWLRAEVAVDSFKVTGGSGLFGGACVEKIL